MDKLSCTDIAQWSAAGCAGLVMGGAFFTNSTAAPALEKTEDTKSALQCWRSLFNTSGNFQAPFALGSAASAVYAWHKCDSDYKWLFLVGTGAILTTIPFRKCLMSSGFDELMEDSVLEKKGESWVRDKISSWSKQHMVRTAVTILAFDCMMLGIFLTR